MQKQKIKFAVDKDTLASMFEQMIGTQTNMEMAVPRFDRIKIRMEKILDVADELAAAPIPADELTIKWLEQLREFAQNGRTELKEFAWNSRGTNDEKTVADFSVLYGKIKKCGTMSHIIQTYDRLIPCASNYEKSTSLSSGFIAALNGVTWTPLSFSNYNFKYVVELPGAAKNTSVFLTMVLHLLYANCRAVYEEISSPDVDVDQFAEIIRESLREVQKRPELSRCKKAFAKIERSLELLKKNFNGYYKDFLQTKDNTIIIQHFILDVSKQKDVDVDMTRQFRSIISYYSKISKEQNINPQMKNIIDRLSQNFSQTDEQIEKSQVDSQNVTVPRDEIPSVPLEN